jgi:hypothetical protein
MFEELRNQEEPARVLVTQQCAQQEQAVNQKATREAKSFLSAEQSNY